MGALTPKRYCVGPHLISEDPVRKPNKVIWVKNTSPLRYYWSSKLVRIHMFQLNSDNNISLLTPFDHGYVSLRYGLPGGKVTRYS